MPRVSAKKRKSAKPAKSSRDKVRAYRARMRARGMRPVQIWLPDVNSEAFRREAARQSRLVRESPGEKETMDFLEAIADWPDR